MTYGSYQWRYWWRHLLKLTEFGSGRRILAGFISRWAIPFEWRNLRARAIEWTSDLTSLSEIILDSAASMRLSNDPEYSLWWLIISHVQNSNNHQKVRVEFENWSLKILEIFEFESLWSHLKNLEDFRDLEDDSKRLLMFQNSSFRIQCDSICPEIKPDKLTAPNKFKDKIKSVIVFKELHHVENIVRLLTLMINFDLAMNLKKIFRTIM